MSEPDIELLQTLREDAKNAITELTETLTDETPDEDLSTLLTEASASFADAEKFADEGANDEALSRMREALEVANQGAIILDTASELTDAK